MHSPDFWQRLQNGVEVAVSPARPDILLGVRDGFLRFFHDGLDRPVPVAVVAQAAAEDHHGLRYTDEEVLASARRQALALHARLGDTYHFYVVSEAGLHAVEVDQRPHTFIRNWVAVVGPGGVEAFGSSGSLQFPDPLVTSLGQGGMPSGGITVPGRRKEGGLIASLTGGLETRRSAVAVSTLHAVSTLLYGVIESRPVRRR